MSTYLELGYRSYNAYLANRHFRRLKNKHIKQNKSAKCFICAKTNNLVIHHTNYTSLGHELINRDIFVICWNCHTKAHYTLLGWHKIPLTPQNLKRRLWFIKCIHSIKRLNPILAAWYFIRWIVTS